MNFWLIYRCASEEAIGKNCREVEGDRTQIYPNCCPRIECDDDFDSDLFEYGSNSLWSQRRFIAHRVFQSIDRGACKADVICFDVKTFAVLFTPTPAVDRATPCQAPTMVNTVTGATYRLANNHHQDTNGWINRGPKTCYEHFKYLTTPRQNADRWDEYHLKYSYKFIFTSL